MHLNAAPTLVSEAPFTDFFGTGSGVAGTATLTRSIDGLSLAIAAENLVTGHAHSVWWAIFDNPEGCKDDGCGVDDLQRRSAQPTLVNGDGFVAAAGVDNFQTHLDRHDVGGREVVLGDPSGVDNPYRAVVHVIIRSHGVAEADPADLAVQTSTFGGFCNLPGVVCANVGVAVLPDPPPPGKP